MLNIELLISLTCLNSMILWWLVRRVDASQTFVVKAIIVTAVFAPALIVILVGTWWLPCFDPLMICLSAWFTSLFSIFVSVAMGAYEL